MNQYVLSVAAELDLDSIWEYIAQDNQAVRQFSAFCAENGIMDLAQVQPIHVAAFVETQLKLTPSPQ